MADLAYEEELLATGADGSAWGVLCMPTRRPASPRLVLMFNAGVVNRAGPHRINVKLARSLAEQGIASLRFDLSGRGDSLGEAAGRATAVRGPVADLIQAFDCLERNHGFARFAVLGLCSGAVDAYEAALADPRVSALSMFDGFIYETPRSRLRWRARRLRAMAATLPSSTLLRRALRIVLPGSPTPLPGAGGMWQHQVPGRSEFRRAVEGLLARGTDVQLAFSGSYEPLFNHAGQLREAFGAAPFLNAIDYHYLPDVDHTFTTLEAQRRYIATVSDWLVRTAPPPEGGYGTVRP